MDWGRGRSEIETGVATGEGIVADRTYLGSCNEFVSEGQLPSMLYECTLISLHCVLQPL